MEFPLSDLDTVTLRTSIRRVLDSGSSENDLWANSGKELGVPLLANEPNVSLEDVIWDLRDFSKFGLVWVGCKWGGGLAYLTLQFEREQDNRLNPVDFVRYFEGSADSLTVWKNSRTLAIVGSIQTQEKPESSLGLRSDKISLVRFHLHPSDLVPT